MERNDEQRPVAPPLALPADETRGTVENLELLKHELEEYKSFLSEIVASSGRWNTALEGALKQWSGGVLCNV